VILKIFKFGWRFKMEMDVYSAKRKNFIKQISHLALACFSKSWAFLGKAEYVRALRLRPKQNGRTSVFDLSCNIMAVHSLRPFHDLSLGTGPKPSWHGFCPKMAASLWTLKLPFWPKLLDFSIVKLNEKTWGRDLQSVRIFGTVGAKGAF
jgi:hypothetical protein